MSHAWFVATGWIATVGSIAVYAVAVLRRGRALSRQVPAEDRRWSG